MASPTPEEDIPDPRIETTYQSPATLAYKLSEYTFGLCEDAEIAKVISRGLRSRMLKERDKLVAAKLFLGDATVNKSLRIALYQFMQKDEDRKALIRANLSEKDKQAVLRATPDFKESRIPLKSKLDLPIARLFEEGGEGLFEALQEWSLTLINTDYFTDAISEEQWVDLARSEDKWAAYERLIAVAELPGRKGLRLALLQFVREKQDLSFLLSAESKQVEIERVPLDNLPLPVLPSVPDQPIVAPADAMLADDQPSALTARLAALHVPEAGAAVSAAPQPIAVPVPAQARNAPPSADPVPDPRPAPTPVPAPVRSPSPSPSSSHLPTPPTTPNAYGTIAEECRQQAFKIGDAEATNVCDFEKGHARIIVNETSVAYPRPNLAWHRFTVQLQAGPKELKSAQLTLVITQAAPSSKSKKSFRGRTSPEPVKAKIRHIYPADNVRWATGNAATIGRTREAGVEVTVGYSDYASFTGHYTDARTYSMEVAPHLTTGGTATHKLSIKCNPGAGGAPNPVAPSFPFDFLVDRPASGAFTIEVGLKIDDGSVFSSVRGGWEGVLEYDGTTKKGMP